jgi:hypothetical protein
MTNWGYTLMTEQSGPKELVGYAVAAEQAGFDFEVSSDHYSRRGRHATRTRPASSARSRSAGTRTRTPQSLAPTTSSAGSAAAGR